MILDPVCVMHGKRMSEHLCLYCCICFEDLTLDTCYVNEAGEREDICVRCAETEKQYLAAVNQTGADLTPAGKRAILDCVEPGCDPPLLS